MPSRTLTILRRHPTTSLIVILLASMLILRLWWGWQTGRMLQAEWHIVRQRGEAVTVDDLAVTPLPDSRNAWSLQSQAATITMNSGVDCPASSSLEYPGYPPFGDAWNNAAADSEAAHTQAFALAREARAFEGLTRSTLQQPLLANLLPANLSGARNLANTLADGALHRHFQRDDLEALERILDALHLAESLRTEPMIIGQLVAIGVEALATHRLQQMAPTLAQRGDPMLRQRLTLLIHRLVSDLGDRDAIRRGFEGERLFNREVVETHASGTWAIRPLADVTLTRVLRESHTWMDATAADSLTEAHAILQQLPPDSIAHQNSFWQFGAYRPSLPRYSRWYSTPSSMDRMFLVIFRQVAEARMTGASLAINLYRADHGRWPETLDDLVPDYLPHLPTDPSQGDGRPIGYVMLKRHDGQARPMVYVDPGGPDMGPNDPEPAFGWQGGLHHATEEAMPEDVRQYRDVSLWLPAERRWDRQEAERKARIEAGESEWEWDWGSAEAVDDDPGEADAPGDEAQPENDDQ